MPKELKPVQVKKNIVYSVGAQFVSLIVSILLNLLVPKFVSEIDYANWQTYLLYVGYVGIFHFGLLDGMLLRFSKYDYDELDKSKIQSHFLILIIMLMITSIIIMCIGCLQQESVVKIIFIMISFAVLSRNIFNYTSYSFQMTNRINQYALLVIVHRIVYSVGIICLLFSRYNNFIFLCIVDVVADIFAIIYGILNNKGMYFSRNINRPELFKDVCISISCGIILLFANWSSMLLIGGAKMIVQWHWSKLVFGKISFAFSISNLFLVFVTAISIVLFPSLKRMNENELPKMYIEIRSAISPFLFIIMVLYFPGSIILEKWLPKYSQSIGYLGLLLPIIIFSSKVSLLTNNYLKAYRKEKSLLIINLVTVVIAFLLYFISAYLFDNLDFVLISVVIIIMLRSIISEVIVSKLIYENLISDYIVEAVLTISFIISTRFSSFFAGFLFYTVILSVYIFYKRKQILYIFSKYIKERVLRKNP